MPQASSNTLTISTNSVNVGASTFLECGESTPLLRLQQRRYMNHWGETACIAKAGASSRTPKLAPADILECGESSPLLRLQGCRHMDHWGETAYIAKAGASSRTPKLAPVDIFGVRRVIAAFTVATVPLHGSLGRNGVHRKGGGKLPHSKACSCRQRATPTTQMITFDVLTQRTPARRHFACGSGARCIVPLRGRRLADSHPAKGWTVRNPGSRTGSRGTGCRPRGDTGPRGP
jgi:hypothetical protein